ncbi:hypothetical protein M440DRAFT_186770 [Trichoderma longibrachiatum ATCC 18648]|uniref:Uncharacterized protein n=1 Tax=Trichoderma longibrachiatum ATCC 18648 TaxID=983965 RepID=A0A2T4CF72_TRILO|nr:hypothetical protein M440DRAFT_186770 [Trichoderma longibrachiatum ATCC 18648]
MPDFIPSHTYLIPSHPLCCTLQSHKLGPWSASPPDGKAPLCILLCISPPGVVLAVLLRSRSSVLVSPPFSRHLMLSCFFVLLPRFFFTSSPFFPSSFTPTPHHQNPSPGKSLSSARLDL